MLPDSRDADLRWNDLASFHQDSVRQSRRAIRPWGISSKYKRMAVSAAGMSAEILAASVAALVWSWAEEGALRTICANTILLASITTLLFNANPLMRFDGYFILADWLEVPNLYANATAASGTFLRSAVLGLGRMPHVSIGLVAYGFACTVWRILVIGTICVVAIAILHGIGIILAAVTLTGALLPQMRAFRSSLAEGRAENLSWAWRRPALILGFVLIVLFAPLFPLLPHLGSSASPSWIERG